jgi:hypothetical protein
VFKFSIHKQEIRKDPEIKEFMEKFREYIKTEKQEWKMKYKRGY